MTSSSPGLGGGGGGGGGGARTTASDLTAIQTGVASVAIRNGGSKPSAINKQEIWRSPTATVGTGIDAANAAIAGDYVVAANQMGKAKSVLK
jgi:hypothetical protein